MTAFEKYKAVKIFGSLNGMRALSIAYVIWHHTNNSHNFLPMQARGFLGVDFFFVISGFLIVTLLLREREKKGNISLLDFYGRRTLRIFPLYYTVLLVVLIACLITSAKMTQAYVGDLPYYAAYISNWHHNNTPLGISWSLATEEQFYLFWPPIERFLGRFAVFILVIFIGVNQFVNFGGLSLILGPAADWYMGLEIMQCTFTPICFGVALAHILHNRSGFDFMYKGLGHYLSPVFILFLLLVILNIPSANISGLMRVSLQFLGALGIGSVVVREDNVFHRPLSLYFVARVGIVSYGMYLFHILIMGFVKKALEHIGLFETGIFFVMTFLATYAVAELSYRYYESYFLNLKKYFKRT